MGEVTRKKRLRIRQAKLDRARHLLGTRTESFGPELAEGVRAMRGAGLIDVFSDDPTATGADVLEPPGRALRHPPGAARTSPSFTQAIFRDPSGNRSR
jgi:hypothetical protein